MRRFVDEETRQLGLPLGQSGEGSVDQPVPAIHLGQGPSDDRRVNPNLCTDEVLTVLGDPFANSLEQARSQLARELAPAQLVARW